MSNFNYENSKEPADRTQSSAVESVNIEHEGIQMVKKPLTSVKYVALLMAGIMTLGALPNTSFAWDPWGDITHPERIVRNVERETKKAIVQVAKISISVDVWNHTDYPVIVEMDNNREKRTIAPHGKATFTAANLLDFPTFHFYDPVTGHQKGSKKVKMTGNSTIEWRG